MRCCGHCVRRGMARRDRRQVSVHPNTVRFHLDNLVADGQVERVEPHRGRPGSPPLGESGGRIALDAGVTGCLPRSSPVALASPDRDSRAMALSWPGVGRQLEAPPAGADTEETIDHLDRGA